MSPLIYKVYLRIGRRNKTLIASFRNEIDAYTFMDDTFKDIAYRFKVSGTRVIVMKFGKIIYKREVDK